MTKKERDAYLKKIKKKYVQEAYKEAQIYCNYKEMFDISSNPQEFQTIWEKASANTKLFLFGIRRNMF